MDEHPEEGETRGHEMFTRIKVASALAVLHQERNVSQQMWEASGYLMENSRRLIKMAEATLHAEAMKAARAKAKFQAATKQYEEEETKAVSAKAMSNEEYAEYIVEQLKAEGGAVNLSAFKENHGGQRKRKSATVEELILSGQIIKYKDPENSRKTLIKLNEQEAA